MSTKVTMSTVKLEVATVNTAPEFSVMKDEKVFGDLRVSRGGAYWRPKSNQQFYHLTWEQLDALFQKQGVEKPVGQYKMTVQPSTYDDNTDPAVADAGPSP